MLDPKTFPLEDWLVGGKAHRYRAETKIYRDPNILAKMEAKRAEWDAQAAVPEGMESLGDTPGPALSDEALMAEMDAQAATVTVVALIDTELAKCKEALGEKPKGYVYEADFEYWYLVIAEAAEITLPGAEPQTLTAEQWKRLHETIGAQFKLVTQAYAEANSPDVTARFRR